MALSDTEVHMIGFILISRLGGGFPAGMTMVCTYVTTAIILDITVKSLIYSQCNTKMR